MNNEDYLREIIREAVEDVLYEFKSDIERETKARLLKDRESGNHYHERRVKGRKEPDNPFTVRGMKGYRIIDNSNKNAIKNIDHDMKLKDHIRDRGKMFAKHGFDMIDMI